MSLSSDIKLLIYSYLLTPSASCIKVEIKRCSIILDQTELHDYQTIWYIMVLYWDKYYTNEKFHFQNVNHVLCKYDLMIAKQICILKRYEHKFLEMDVQQYIENYKRDIRMIETKNKDVFEKRMYLYKNGNK